MTLIFVISTSFYIRHSLDCRFPVHVLFCRQILVTHFYGSHAWQICVSVNKSVNCFCYTPPHARLFPWRRVKIEQMTCLSFEFFLSLRGWLAAGQHALDMALCAFCWEWRRCAVSVLLRCRTELVILTRFSSIWQHCTQCSLAEKLRLRIGNVIQVRAKTWQFWITF